MNEHELRNMMYTAQLPDKGPFVIRYPRGRGVLTDWRCPFEEMPIGKGRLMGKNKATDCQTAVLSLGPIGNVVAKVVRELKEEEGCDVVHYDMRFLKPIDEEILHEVGTTCRRIVTVEDGVVRGGLGTAVIEYMADHNLHPEVVRLGLPDNFVEHGTPEELYHLVGLDADTIKLKIKNGNNLLTCQLVNYKTMKIVIAGAGAVGSHLAALLSREDQDIILIDESPEKTARLLNSSDLDLMTLNVSPTSIRGLKEGGVHQSDLFIAVTPEETRNITCCMLAHTLGARKTIARVDTAEYTQPQYRDLFQQMGVSSIIYPEGLAAREILDGLKRSWVRQYWEVAGGALVMLGIKLREKARITGVALRDLCDAQTPYRIVAIKRGDNTIIPSGNDELRIGDTTLLLDEGLADMQAFCALTPETETNILACLAAKRMGVRKTVALVDNTDYISMAEKLDIGTIINKKMIAAGRIYQMMLDSDAHNVKCLTVASADVAEVVVQEGSPACAKPVFELRLPSGITLGGKAEACISFDQFSPG